AMLPDRLCGGGDTGLRDRAIPLHARRDHQNADDRLQLRHAPKTRRRGVGGAGRARSKVLCAVIAPRTICDVWFRAAAASGIAAMGEVAPIRKKCLWIKLLGLPTREQCRARPHYALSTPLRAYSGERRNTIYELESSMNQVQVEQKSYQMP